MGGGRATGESRPVALFEYHQPESLFKPADIVRFAIQRNPPLMALLGRDTEAQRQRAESVQAWVQARSPYALASAMLGLIAVVDALTLVIGAIAGLAAIAMAIRGFGDLRRLPGGFGRRLCYLGLGLGTLALTTSGLLWALLG